MSNSVNLQEDVVKSEVISSTGAKSKALYLGIDIGMSNIAVYSDKGSRHVQPNIISDNDFDAGIKEPVKSLFSGDRKAIGHVRNLLEQCIDNAGFSKKLENSYALITVPHVASDLYKRSVLEIAQDMFKSAMVVDGMFCVAYGCGETESSIFVDIGTVSSRICCINVDQPDEMNCLVIDSGAGEIERELLDMITEEHEGLIITKEIVREWVHSHSYVGGHADEFKAELMLEDGSTKGIIITEELGLASEYLVSDILSGLIKMLSTIDPVSRDKVRNNIHICGGGSKIQNIGGFMENELKELGGGKVSLVDDPAFAGAIGAWMLAEKMPLEFWERASVQKNKIVGTIT